MRATRARYPNSNSESEGFDKTVSAKGYLPVKTPAPFTDFYPEYPLRTDTSG